MPTPPVTPERSPKSTARSPGEGDSITESKKPSIWAYTTAISTSLRATTSLSRTPSR